MKQYDFALKAIQRPLRKAISSQFVFSSFELLNLKPPIFGERRYEEWRGGLAQWPHNRYMDAWVEFYRMAKKAI